jgi:hypothetical protein
MRLFKSLLAGLLMAVLVVALWIAVNVFRAFHMDTGGGSGSIGTFVMWDYEAYLAASIGFILGFVWTYRRKSLQ